ncbi:hypothetical protein HK405_011563, partial [Cladochytrium tenue]
MDKALDTWMANHPYLKTGAELYEFMAVDFVDGDSNLFEGVSLETFNNKFRKRREAVSTAGITVKLTATEAGMTGGPESTGTRVQAIRNLEELTDCTVWADNDAAQRVLVLVCLLNNFTVDFEVSEDGGSLIVNMTNLLRTHSYWLPGAPSGSLMLGSIINLYPDDYKRPHVSLTYSVRLPKP